MALSEEDFVALAAKAYQIMKSIPDIWGSIAYPRYKGKPSAIVHFARVLTNAQNIPVNVFAVSNLPVREYLSWLTIRKPKVPGGIAISSSELSKWARNPGLDHPPPNVMHARTVLHELGHIFATKELLEGQITTLSGRDYALAANPQQEERAWAFAFMLVSRALGDYSLQWCSSPKPGDGTACIRV